MSNTIDELPPSSSVPNEPTEPAPVEARPYVRPLRAERPPYDIGTEQALLGAALYNGDAADLIAAHDPAIFYIPAHQEIATAISVLRSHGEAVDPVSVRAEVLRRNPATSITDSDYIGLQVSTPSAKHASTYLHTLQEHLQLRQLQSAGDRIQTSALRGDVESALEAAETIREVVLTDVGDTTWGLVDLTPILDDEAVELPTMLARNDGKCLIYRGRTHAFNAESEAGKSWLALYLCKERIDIGEDVLYIDCEDSAQGIIGRLKLLGLHRDNIAEQFHYIRPDDPFSTQAAVAVQEAVEKYEPSVCILDGITEVMAMNNWGSLDNDDIATMLNHVVRPIERTGTAVVMLDHVTKNKETQGLYAIGGQHKRAGITGASYKLTVTVPFGQGRSGQVAISVTKDRPGSVRGWAIEGKHAAVLAVDASKGLKLSILAPTDPGATGFLPTVLMERASRALEDTDGALSKSQWRTLFDGRASARLHAMDALVREGYVRRFSEKGKTVHELVKPYRQLQLVPALDDNDEDF